MAPPAEVATTVETSKRSDAEDTEMEPAIKQEGNETTAVVPPPAPSPASPAPAPASVAVIVDSPSSSAASEIDISHIRDEDIQWLWTAQEFKEWTPSRGVGLDAGVERQNRYLGISFIYQIGERLTLYGTTLHAASTYFHRFFLRKAMKSEVTEPGQQYDYTEVAVACIFLAIKTEEQYRKLSMILESAIELTRANTYERNPIGQSTAENFRRWRDTVIAYEDELFPTLCADLVVPQPLSMFIEACQIFKVDRELIYNGVNMLHDMNRDIYCQLCEANVQAAAVFYIVHLLADCDYLEYKMPEELRSSEQDDPEQAFWPTIFFCEESDMQECATAIREFYHWKSSIVEASCAELASVRENRSRASGQGSSTTEPSPLRHGPSFDASQATPVNHRLQAPSQAHNTSLAPPLSSPPLHTNGHHSHRLNQDTSSSSAYTPHLNSSNDHVSDNRQLPYSEQTFSSQVADPTPAVDSSSPRSRYRQHTQESHDVSSLLSPEMPPISPGPQHSSAFASQSAAVATGAAEKDRSGYDQHADDHDESMYNLESPVVAQESDNEEKAGADVTTAQTGSEAGAPTASKWQPIASQHDHQHRYGAGAHDYRPVSPQLAHEDDADEEGAVNDDV
ncbi:hypothetical protein OC845_005381 [Tilletia horrida]|nr:hypothetical protein OC845_005381 [Tilletia horrida]